jgi:hypothetical protein
MEGIIHYELFERNLTVTAECYWQQLRRLEEAIQQIRPGRRHGVIFQHENSRPHMANMMKSASQEFYSKIFSIFALLSGSCPIRLPPLSLSLFNNLRGVSFNDAELQNNTYIIN